MTKATCPSFCFPDQCRRRWSIHRPAHQEAILWVHNYFPPGTAPSQMPVLQHTHSFPHIPDYHHFKVHVLWKGEHGASSWNRKLTLQLCLNVSSPEFGGSFVTVSAYLELEYVHNHQDLFSYVSVDVKTALKCNHIRQMFWSGFYYYFKELSL